jgi:5,10-methylenetetrahydromethanopterin reductase
MPKVGITFNGSFPLDRVSRYVKFAEQNAFHSIWFAEHFFLRDSLISMAAVAGGTTRLKFGTGIISPYTREPALLAMSVETMSDLLKDRFILGLGTNTRFWDILGTKDAKPLRTMRRIVMMLREIHQGKEVEIDSGDSRPPVRAKLDFVSRCSLPIYIGALGHQMLKLSGQIADGVLLSNVSATKYVERSIKLVKEGIDQAGRNARDFEFACYILALSNAEQSTRQRARERIASLLSVPGREELLGDLAIEGLSNKIKDTIATKGILEASKLITDEMVDLVTIPSSAEECIEKVNEYRKSGVTLPILSPVGQEFEGILKSLAGSE